MRHQVGLSYAASLAQLGNVAWEGSPLAELKRPGSFLERQVPQFLRLLESYRHDRYAPESLAVGELAEWLESNRPSDGTPGIMHGDPHLSNVLLRRDKPELAAFVDWEMCTVGDPLLDLGWMLICWPLDTNTITAGAELAALGGLATRGELLDAYRAAGGRETRGLEGPGGGVPDHPRAEGCAEETPDARGYPGQPVRRRKDNDRHRRNTVRDAEHDVLARVGVRERRTVGTQQQRE